jgi:hypothetical protein
MKKRQPGNLVAVPVAGIPWYARKNWPALKAVLADASTLPETFEEWRRAMAAVESQMRHEGFVVERVDIDPETFPQWCKSQGLITDERARDRFAAETARERHGQSE